MSLCECQARITNHSKFFDYQTFRINTAIIVIVSKFPEEFPYLAGLTFNNSVLSLFNNRKCIPIHVLWCSGLRWADGTHRPARTPRRRHSRPKGIYINDDDGDGDGGDSDDDANAHTLVRVVFTLLTLNAIVCTVSLVTSYCDCAISLGRARLSGNNGPPGATRSWASRRKGMKTSELLA